MKNLLRYLAFALPTSALLLTAASPFTPATSDDDDDEIMCFELAPFEVQSSASVGYMTSNSISATRISATRLGATPGGAQDINHFRMAVAHGRVPHPNTFTPEGLFSQHDLPLDLGRECSDPFYLETAAIPARFELVPEIEYFAQLSFKSGLDPATWHRAPLNLVAVVDKSGSMSGQPLELVRRSLLQVLSQMNAEDQLSIVLYGDQSHLFLAPTQTSAENRALIENTIRTIASAGSTYMESGLALGYQVARDSASQFDGTTRLMLFTDERPNVGRTDANSFMGMAESAARDGIGLTTIGVGIEFGGELATRISGVRGGNLFFFADAPQMVDAFESKFDTMVTELAYDFSVRLSPATGYEIAAVYGVPNEALEWDGDAIVLNVETIFLSRERGGIYFALKRANGGDFLPSRHHAKDGDTLAEVSLSYLDATSRSRYLDTLETCFISDASDPGLLGLRRGTFLVDEFLTLKEATRAHYEDNDQSSGFHLLKSLAKRQQAESDATMDDEKSLVTGLRDTLAILSGNHAEIAAETGSDFPLCGTWRLENRSSADQPDYVIFWSETEAEFGWMDEDNRELAHIVERRAATADTPSTAVLEFENGRQLLAYHRRGDDFSVSLVEEGAPEPPETFLLTACSWNELFSPADATRTPKDPLTGLPAKRQW